MPEETTPRPDKGATPRDDQLRALAGRWRRGDAAATAIDELHRGVLELLAKAARAHSSHEPVEDSQASAMIDVFGSHSWVGELWDDAVAGEHYKCAESELS